MRIGNHRMMSSKKVRTLDRIPMRAQGFAMRLGSRYRMGGIVLSRPAMPLLIHPSDASTTIIQQHYHHWPVNQSARVLLTFLLHRTTRLIMAQTRGAMAMPTREPGPHGQLEHGISPSLQGGAMVERFLQQHQRIETKLTHELISRAGRPGAGGSVVNPVATAPGLVEMALVRVGAKAATTAESRPTEFSVSQNDAMTSGETRDPVHGSLKQAVSASAKRMEMNEREVEQLAERVIRSIDKRIVAQRERLGRF